MALLPFMSRIIADVGISMGDEGKGRLICEVINELRQTNDGINRVGAVMYVNGGAAEDIKDTDGHNSPVNQNDDYFWFAN